MLKLQAIGTLGKDATVNNVNGKNVINFSIAHSEKFKDRDGNQQEKTTWVDCAMWRDQTTVAQYLTKGTKVYIEGAPEVRTFQKNDGTSAATLSVRVNQLELLGGGQRNDNQGGGYVATPPPQSQQSLVDDDPDGLPF